MSETERGEAFRVRISAGAPIVYSNDIGDPEVGTVRHVDADRELIEVSGIPGVLRMRDIVAVGVYGDEAKFHLDPAGPGGDRITRDDQEES